MKIKGVGRLCYDVQYILSHFITEHVTKIFFPVWKNSQAGEGHLHWRKELSCHSKPYRYYPRYPHPFLTLANL